MTTSIIDHQLFLIFMSATSEDRIRAAILGWIRHDLSALKRSYASVNVCNTRRRG